MATVETGASSVGIAQNGIERRLVASVDGATVEARLRASALEHVVRNLAPLALLVAPFTLLVAFVMRRDIGSFRAQVWVGVSVGVAILSVVTRWFIARATTRESGARRRLVFAATTLAGTSAVFGLAPWVAADRPIEVLALFILFPAVSCAIAAVICAGRRDLYLVCLATMNATSTYGLWSANDERMRALAVVSFFYAICLVTVHHQVSRSLLSSLRLQLVSDDLVAQLAREQQALTDAFEQLSASNEQLAHLASHDPLTGLHNRRGTLESIDELLEANVDQPIGLLYCDLDRFKAVNDLLGHRGGDQFLNVLADRIARTIDHGCTAGRIGGDEFVIVLPGHDLAMSMAIANRLTGVLAQPVHAEGREVPSSVSIGVAASPEHGTTSSDLLRNANAALYRAKHAGRNRVELFDGDMRVELEAMLEAEQALRRALDHGEILPFFQPEIDATTGQIVGAELLARWLRSDGTVVSAAEFIALARKAGLLEKLTERVLAQARPHIRRLASLGLPDGFRFRVNLAPSSTERSWRTDPIDELVRGIDPTLLTVDVRESAVTSDLPAAAATLAAFRARGGRVCLDDFARGVSSLSLLRRLPIDEVRIDRLAIDTITAHPHDRAIVRSIIAVVREIGLSVTAEGVETGAQADALIALGCVRQQGHLYAKALPAEELESYLLERLAEGYVALQSQTHAWDTGELD